MSPTGIEWTEETWNPVTGCDEVSPGCANCYAKTFAERFRGVAGHPYEHGFDLQLRPDRLKTPLGWKKPRTVFVNSMSDLFHPDIPPEYTGSCLRDHDGSRSSYLPGAHQASQSALSSSPTAGHGRPTCGWVLASRISAGPRASTLSALSPPRSAS